MLKLREDGSPLPAGGITKSPWVDLACTGETVETNATADLTATKVSLQRMAGQYIHGADPRTPLASPLYADLSGLPPLLIVVEAATSALTKCAFSWKFAYRNCYLADAPRGSCLLNEV